ncbi:Adaptive-response sensory-kinase SasA [Dyadobacter sp. CECT 9623]|uniref:histidine kinase n=1 Tax=Dyadobacter linearis TaxID=2823330 RepID=A0ABM8USH4_9BACT|nr:ATP-binding protein [Dyadobacter sp. CECT 9623]CAG5070687.1 Adaptive-response sensory-kinase SasA [Dyadobacter sp. CECT 9623]
MDKWEDPQLVLVSADELRFQDTERDKRAKELIIANKELVFQNKEKGKRADELIIANRELLRQNIEKGKRAEELIKANEELALQNAEVKKLSVELDLLNKELALQYIEKEKQALILEAANQELESFSYSVSHDLRAPLRAVNGFTQILLEDYIQELGEDAQYLLTEIIANSNKMGQLIDNLLDFSRLSKQQISVSNVDTDKMVKSVITQLRQLEPGREISFDIKELDVATGDPSMLRQVYVNLISNAMKYSSKKELAHIEIGCFPKDGFCTFYIKDDGAGFDMTYYDKLFGVFQRLHSSNEFEGTGVGLAIVQKIIVKHGGKVWAEGKVGEGACFYFSIPIPAELPLT